MKVMPAIPELSAAKQRRIQRLCIALLAHHIMSVHDRKRFVKRLIYHRYEIPL
ncbi:MAG: hypothetical protein ABSB79_06190 [Syntrophales bacterium]|jgi:hypothetical protein